MYEEKRYKPLSPWAYFGYTLLFSLPVAGIILLIVFSFSAKNINLKNFARSYFCGIALVIILVFAAFILRKIGIISGNIATFLANELKKLKIF